MAKRKMSAKKKFAAVTASILALALLIGGAFAWTDFSQNAINRFRGNVDPDVTLHDDFEQDINKDVYVENTGEVDLIVRVKFNEYFQIGNVPIVGGNANDKDTWETHMFPTGAREGSIPAVAGELDDNCKLDSHEYFSWLISGATKIYKPGTGEMGNYDYTDGETFPDGTIAKPTLPEMAPITMAEYIANKPTYDAETDGRWILDTDGWCYWSKLLVKDTATNLLLDNVVKTKDPDDNYLYNIDVILQASNVTEAYLLIGKGMSDEAENHIVGDLTGIIKLQDGTKIKATETPKFYEVLDNNGKSRNPREYLYDPDDNIKNDKDINGDEKPAVKGKDNNFWIDNEDGTFTNYKNNLVIIPPAGQMPGGNDDKVQTPDFPLNINDQAVKFSVVPIPIFVQGGNRTHQIKLEFVDPSQAAAAKPLRYLVAESAGDNITISNSGLLTLKASAPSNTGFNFYVIAADGSCAAGTSSFQLDTAMKVDIAAKFDPINPAYFEFNYGKAIGAAPVSSTGGVARNVITNNYQITGANLGCTVTTNGWFESGNTAGTVQVRNTVTCVNYSDSPLTLLDGTDRVIASGGEYTLTTIFDVIINAAPSPEATPVKTKLTDLGVTSWTAIEPAPSYASGNGTAANPYKISSIRQLKKLSNDSAVMGATDATYKKYFELTANMDFNGADFVSGALINGFQGTFDGKDKVITGLKSDSGIFDTVAFGAVKNFGRTGGELAPISGASTGAICLILNNASLTRCYNTTNVTTSHAVQVGGITMIAEGKAAVIENCYNKGNISATTITGGVVGYVRTDAGSLTIKNSYNAGNLSSSVCGGAIGQFQTTANGQTVIIDNFRNYGTVTRTSGTQPDVGGIIGRLHNPAAFHKIIMTNVSYKTGTIFHLAVLQADTDIGRVIGLGTGGSITGAGTNDLTGSAPAGFLV